MSRVHDALRRATQENPDLRGRVRPDRVATPRPEPPRQSVPPPPTVPPTAEVPPAPAVAYEAEERVAPQRQVLPAAIATDVANDLVDLEDIISAARVIPYTPMKDALIVHPLRPREAPAEEFKTLRTRLDHLQRMQPLHTLVITSASPAEGKSFTAINLAITQSQLAEKRILLADFDFRRPSIHSTFQIPCCPGITDYLTGKARLSEIMCRVADTNLYILPAGESVPNPLELLNLKECKTLIDDLRNHFDWVILDSPPLLFAADGNLLATMCDGTILVVRIASTTYDSVARAMQSLCENNVLGVVVNGARRGELYSKYTYYHDYYYSPDGELLNPDGEPENAEAHDVVVNTK